MSRPTTAPDVVDGEVVGRVGVLVGAERLRTRCAGLARVALGAPEHHVLEEVREARSPGLDLVARADADDNPEGDDSRAVVPDRDHLEAVGEGGRVDRVGEDPVAGRRRRRPASPAPSRRRRVVSTAAARRAAIFRRSVMAAPRRRASRRAPGRDPAPRASRAPRPAGNGQSRGASPDWQGADARGRPPRCCCRPGRGRRRRSNPGDSPGAVPGRRCRARRRAAPRHG